MGKLCLFTIARFMKILKSTRLIALLLLAAVLFTMLPKLQRKCTSAAIRAVYGTYVRPHYRSDPDGVFGNNWSTSGNVNPHTGKPGWIRTPPKGYGGGYRSRLLSGSYNDNGSDSADDSYARERAAPERPKYKKYKRIEYETDKLNETEKVVHGELVSKLQDYGKDYTWRHYTPSELQGLRERIEVAERIRQLGVSIAWYSETLPRLRAIEEQLRDAAPSDRRQLLASLRRFSACRPSDVTPSR